MTGAIFPVASAGGVHTGIVGMDCIASFLRHRTNVASAPKPTRTEAPGMKLSRFTWLVEPPKKHPHSDVKPECTSDEIAFEEMADRVEPCDGADVKSTPIERHHEHEKNHYRPHFRILSPT